MCANQSPRAEGRTYDVLTDVVALLEATPAVTDLLETGADDIHPGWPAHAREDRVALGVKIIGGSSTRRGRLVQATYRVQVRLEWSPDWHEQQPTRWPYRLTDEIAAVLDEASAGDGVPLGQAGVIDPQYNAERNRHMADSTYRYTTMHEPTT